MRRFSLICLSLFLAGCASPCPATLRLPPGVMVNYVTPSPSGCYTFKGLGSYRVQQPDGRWIIVLRKGDPNAPEFLRWELAAIREGVTWDADPKWNQPWW